QDNATKWLSDTPGQDAYSINLIEISVYYKKTDQGWVLEPYNQQNKAHFIQFLRDGLDSVDDIVIRKDACSLSTTMGERLLTYGVKKMPSAYPEYEAYEDKRHIPENPYFHEFYYIKKGENPAIITHRNNRINQTEEDSYSTSVGSCINGFTVQYYPFIREKQQLTQQELVGYHQQVEQLVQSFVNNSNKNNLKDLIMNEGEVVLTPEQIQTLRGYASRGDTYGGWRYLANLGDRYADNAAAIVGKDTNLNGLNLWMKKGVENLWDDTVGKKTRLEKFDRVALQHFSQYVDLINKNNGRLPNTSEIERSYYKAVTYHGVSSSAAIDLVINRSLPDMADGYWALGLGIEAERIHNEQAVNNPNGSESDNRKQLISALDKGFDGSFKEKHFTFLQSVIMDVTKLGVEYTIDGWQKIGGWGNGIINDLYKSVAKREWTGIFEIVNNNIKQFRDLFPNPEGWIDDGHQCFAPWVKETKKRNGKYHVYDPLALDLDGDGIETVATKGFAGALFDHRNQGIRTATGWVSADDGLLVRDLNGNGIIDNGAELFGDNTKLADGSFAKHGYAALAELDSNGDNIINAADAAFQTLRVWQDLNQDGISQANELRTLEELGIQSLDLAYKDVNKNLGNGNTLAQQGSYTKTDGTTAKMGDLLLAADNLHSRFTNKMLSISHVRENTISPFVLGCLNK
ncbi:RTX iron-regulated FrpC family protein, partial [Neisseria meningitidis M7089]